ncbi:MAG TPA: methyl-accepting chemotaxis protein [Syntrophomonadaceae bacterium]|mgnify:CR=1 FL=1|nr:methyl-accepting chemotaxis protein [Syntrophomonadaceae bacterium]
MQSDILTTNMYRSHRLLIAVTIIITILANLMALIIYFSGKGSSTLTLSLILREFLLLAVIIGTTIFLANKYPHSNWIKYATISMFAICILVFDCLMSADKEVFANFYLVMALSLLYLDIRLSLFSSVLVLIFHSILVALCPHIMPDGNLTVIIAERYINFVFFGIASAFIASVVARVLHMSIEKENEARQLNSNLREVAVGVSAQANIVADSAGRLTNHARETQKAAEQVTLSVNSLAQATNDEAVYAGNAAQGMQQISKDMDRIGDTIQSINKQSLHFSDIVDEGHTIIANQSRLMSESNKAHESASQAVHTLEIKSKQISEIVNVIKDIANQTNLLSLNAGIEAARAGEAGRGFAIVAEEIRKLAEESERATYNISQLIGEIHRGMTSTVEIIDQTNRINAEQIDAVNKTQEMFTKVEKETQNLNQAISDITSIIQNIVRSTEKMLADVENIFASIEETAAGSQQIASLSNEQTRALTSILNMAEELTRAAEKLQNLVTGIE